MESPAFTPVHPPRTDRLAPVWAAFFGERSRNSIAGWSHAAFDGWYVRRQVLGLTVHIPRHPDMIEHVLLGNAGNYVKPRVVKRLIAPLIGEGLLTANGELWRTQRRIVAPTFAPGAVAALTPLIVAAARAQMRAWPASGTIDIAHAATDTTMTIIADALFSGDPRLKTEAASRHISNALEAAGSVRMSAILGLPQLGLRRTVRLGQQGRVFLRDTLTRIVRERGPTGGDDFLGQMIRDLHARFPATRATMLAIDNAATFYVAGHETTANALTWSAYLLAGDPAAQDRARAEAVAALDGDPGTLADRLPYLRRVLDEALRLYPPAPRFDREAVAADRLGDHAVAAGDIVSVWPWLIHRHRRLWDAPDRFDPDRFLPERTEGRPRFQYLPFGAGPRTCVGMRFAIVEALAILAHWLAAYRFTLDHEHPVEPVGTVTLRPAKGLMLRVERLESRGFGLITAHPE